VLNEVAFGWKIWACRARKIRQRVDEALDFLKISHLRDREPSIFPAEKNKRWHWLVSSPCGLHFAARRAAGKPRSSQRQDTLDTVASWLTMA